MVKDGISPSLKSANLTWLRMATYDWVGNICFVSKRRKWGELGIRRVDVSLMVRYFLAKRDWAKYNKEDNSGWPCQAFVNSTSTMKGDVGFTAKHDSKDDEKDTIRGVIKVSPSHPKGMI
jgi:hypothetical protein